MHVVCLACGHAADVPGPPPEESILVCGECNARVSFGRLMPRVVVEPNVSDHRRWLRLRFQDASTKLDVHVVDLDAQYAASLAKNILSLVIP